MRANTSKEQIERQGFALLPAVFTPTQTEQLLQALTTALHSGPDSSALIQNDAGHLYGARNLLQLWPPVQDIWRQPPLPACLSAILGPGFGLVRVLYFDKPPGRSWALPWHKDLTIAAQDNTLPSKHFGKPTRKAGVPHVEAPLELLQQMLTLRVHLDDITEENGPLRVIPGSHHTGKTMLLDDTPPYSIHGQRGDVLLMRPLLVHCSNTSHPDTNRHRRILHLEFAAASELADGYTWHTFLAGKILSLP